MVIAVRSRPDGPAMPDHDHWQNTLPGQRQFLSVEEFASRYGSAEADLAVAAQFAESQGLTVTESIPARRRVVAVGTVAQMDAAFGVTLNRYECPVRKSRRRPGLDTEEADAVQTYRGFEGPVYLPEVVANVVTAVIGLDNRPLGGVNQGDPPNTNLLTVPEVMQLYDFPTTGAANQTIGIFNGGGNYNDTPTTGDIALYYASLPSTFKAPTIVQVPANSNQPTLAGQSALDYEITQDICISSTVAQGATIAVYFETNDETGWEDWLANATMPTAGEPNPSVLSSCWIFSFEDDAATVGQAVLDRMSSHFQAAAGRGITVLIAAGDSGSNDGLGVDHCYVEYASSDPWVTACGGTTIGNVAANRSSFDEIVWNDTFFGGQLGQTGGGVSDYFPQPSWQAAAGVAAASKNDNMVRRGIPDIAGNASPNSGYPYFMGGQSATMNGTSAVAPLYAGLSAVINQTLGERIGFLNPTLYALGSQLGVDLGINPFRDITQGDNNPNDGSNAPYYTAGPGWDACSGWGSVSGNLLQSALQVLFKRDCMFVIDRSTYGQDEIDGLRTQPGGAVVTGAFYLIVDGFTPSQLGITNATSLSAAPPIVFSPATGVSASCSSLVSDDPSFGPEVQRFRFGYDVSFGSTDAAFSFASSPETVIITTSLQGIPASGQLHFIKQPDPYILQGAQTWWLSDDIRLIQVAEGGSQFGVTMGTDPHQFLLDLTSALEASQGAGFDNNADEDSEVLTVAPTNSSGKPVYNFAIARVHYLGDLDPADNVRVFFRLFAANSTATDFQPTATYQRFPAVYPVPTAQYGGNELPTFGVAAGEYVSVPCFAEPRLSATQSGAPNSLPSLQTPDTLNVRNIAKTGTGPVHDTFFGAWLDINQMTPVLPTMPPSGNEDGPWPPSSGTAVESLRQSFIVNEHQCMVAEIAFDPDPIPAGTAPWNSDKFAQRNISWSYVANPGVPASRRAIEPFEVRPSPSSLGAGEMPDELMIDWTNVPEDQQAEIYLPHVDAKTVLAMAAELYSTEALTLVDAHTVGCATGGVTYIPLPQGSGNGANFVGLMSVNLPYGIKKGQSYTVVVRQVTNAAATVTPPPPPPPISRTGAPARHELTWRSVLGTFQVNIPVSTKEALLPKEEQRLAIFRWIFETMPKQRRWYPVLQRYLEGIAGRVEGFGGDPNKILPSPTGYPTPIHVHPGHGDGHPGGHRQHDGMEAHTGKVAGLIFDRFSDFEGFILDTEHGEREYFCREKDTEDLVERAWRDRLRITVWTKHDAPWRAETIIVREPPAHLG